MISWVRAFHGRKEPPGAEAALRKAVDLDKTMSTP